MKIDSKAIEKIAELLEKTGTSEIEVKDGDQSIRVSKGGGAVVAAALCCGRRASGDGRSVPVGL